MFVFIVTLFLSVVTHAVQDLWKSFKCYIGAELDVMLLTLCGARWKVSTHRQEQRTVLKCSCLFGLYM